MLKITMTHSDDDQRVLMLEGKLLADWVGELQGACRAACKDPRQLQLDLSHLLFVDVSGVSALRELIRHGVSITASSPFVGELLKEI